MNPSPQPRMRACLSFLLFFMIGNMVSAQTTTYTAAVSVDSAFITGGKKHFKDNVKNPKQMTEQIAVSYATLKEFVEQADSNYVFIITIVGIDKNDKEDQKVWGTILGVPDIKDYNKHQGLIFGIVRRPNTMQNATGTTSPKYFAMGRLCPPPVCPIE